MRSKSSDRPGGIRHGLRRYQVLAWVQALNDDWRDFLGTEQPATSPNLTAYMLEYDCMTQHFMKRDRTSYTPTHRSETYEDLRDLLLSLLRHYRRDGDIVTAGKVKKTKENHLDVREEYTVESSRVDTVPTKPVTRYEVTEKGREKVEDVLPARFDYLRKIASEEVSKDTVTVPNTGRRGGRTKTVTVPRVTQSGKPIDD